MSNGATVLPCRVSHARVHACVDVCLCVCVCVFVCVCAPGYRFQSCSSCKVGVCVCVWPNCCTACALRAYCARRGRDTHPRIPVT